MASWQKASVNDYVLVRLTPFGEKKWAEYWKRTCETMRLPYGVPADIRKAAVQKDGRVQFQLWQLMSIFGDEMYMGNTNQCFRENKIWWMPQEN